MINDLNFDGAEEWDEELKGELEDTKGIFDIDSDDPDGIEQVYDPDDMEDEEWNDELDDEQEDHEWNEEAIDEYFSDLPGATVIKDTGGRVVKDTEKK